MAIGIIHCYCKAVGRGIAGAGLGMPAAFFSFPYALRPFFRANLDKPP